MAGNAAAVDHQQPTFYHGESSSSSGRVLTNPGALSQGYPPSEVVAASVKPSRSYPMLAPSYSPPPAPRTPARAAAVQSSSRGSSPVSPPRARRPNGIIQKSPLRRTVHAAPAGYGGKPRSPYNSDDAARARAGSFTHVTPRRRPAAATGDCVIANPHARAPLPRSNSSLSVDDDGSGDAAAAAAVAVARRREYGSASSIDVMTTSPAASGGFLAIFKDYVGGDDRDGGAPRQVKSITLPASVDAPLNGYDDSPTKKGGGRVAKLKEKDKLNIWTRSETFLKRFGGGGGGGEGARALATESGGDAEARVDEKRRRLALAHHDTESVAVDLAAVVRNRNSLTRRRNTATGASAASMLGSGGGALDGSTEELDRAEESAADAGDGKCSEAILSCPFFRNEVGGEEVQNISLNRGSCARKQRAPPSSTPVLRSPAATALSILDSCRECDAKRHVIERVDEGALYYRRYFLEKDHQNFFGIDENLGPVAVSIRRERVDDGSGSLSLLYQHRIIMRTSELPALRGTVVEESIPATTKPSGSRPLPVKDVLEYVVPDLQTCCLKLATSGPQTCQQLMKVDEQVMTPHYKIGIMYCKAGQSTEEEMYNNEHSGPAFDEFLETLGTKVRLKDFLKYKGGLDTKTDSTGLYSLYATYQEYEVMFHVSTMLPYSPNNKQQLLRKRHIGNDIVTIVFQEPGAHPFTPKTVRSHFQHVFIVVRAHEPNTANVKYSVAVTRSKDVPAFGPAIPKDKLFSKSKDCAEFIIAKAINGENAAHRSEKFIAMATRTKQEYLKDLATNYVTTTSLDSGPTKFSKFSLSTKRKDKPRPKLITDAFVKGALVWQVQTEDFSQSSQLDCLLGISVEHIVLVEETSKEPIFTTRCRSVIGWTASNNSLRIYYRHGECVVIRTIDHDIVDEVKEICQRLVAVTQGVETSEMTLRRNSIGQLGFHVHVDGMVTEVEQYGFAWQSGLRKGSRLVEICKVAVATMSHDQMVDLLRTSATVKVVVISGLHDGMPRRGCIDARCRCQHPSPDSKQTRKNQEQTPSGTPADRPDSQANWRTPGYKTSPRTPGYDRQGGTTADRHKAVLGPDKPTLAADRQTPSTTSSDRQTPATTDRQTPSTSADRQTPASSTDRQTPVLAERQVAAAAAAGAEAGVLVINEDGSISRQSSGRGSSLEGRVSRQSSDGHVSYKSSEGFSSRQGSGEGQFLQGGSGGDAGAAAAAAAAATPGGGVAGRHDNVAKPQDETWLNNNAPIGEPALKHSLNGTLQSNSSQSSGASSEKWYDTCDDGELSTGFIDKDSSGSSRGSRRNLSHQKRLYLETLARNSASPKPTPTRPARDVSPLTGEMTRLRPGVTALTRLSPAALKTHNSSTFQEDLLRLIDPDLMLPDQDKDNKVRSSPDRRQLLQRTVSDESVHRSATLQQNRPAFPPDVLFTSAKPAHVSGALMSKESRLSPRALTALPSGGKTGRSARNGGKGILPLPDDGDGAGLDWNNLVETATKAIQSNVSPALATDAKQDEIPTRDLPQPRQQDYDVQRPLQDFDAQRPLQDYDTQRPLQDYDAQHPLKDYDVQRPLQDYDVQRPLQDYDVQHPVLDYDAQQRIPEYSAQQQQQQQQQLPLQEYSAQQRPLQDYDAQRSRQGYEVESRQAVAALSSAPQDLLASGRLSSSPVYTSGPWRPTSTNPTQRQHELELRVAQLQQELNKERQERAEREAEIQQLQQDNVRLQEESQTAAAQLRKFTEWFFNTIDRQ